MPGVEQHIIRECKQILNTSNTETSLGALQAHYKYVMECDWTDQGQQPDWAFILQKVYLHACLKGHATVASWLQTMFTTLNPIQQIAYRQTFAYGRVLLQRAKESRPRSH